MPELVEIRSRSVSGGHTVAVPQVSVSPYAVITSEKPRSSRIRCSSGTGTMVAPVTASRTEDRS